MFDETVVLNLFPDRSEGARKLLVHRALSQAEIIRLKPGFFMLAREFRRTEPHPFIVAAMLHFPSHVSRESALSYHGLIPEAVYQVSCVTPERSRSFTTPLGQFDFKRVPVDDCHAGVEAVKIDARFWAFVATPLRAIADLVYLHPEVSWKRDGLRFLTESMRIEEDDLLRIDLARFDENCRAIRNERTRTYLRKMREEMGRC